MASSTAVTVAAYLAELPAERRAVVSAVRDAVNACVPAGYAEAMAFGMIGWGVPLDRYPNTYNGQPLSLVGLAAQKNGYSLYLNCLYGSAEREEVLRAAYAESGLKLDMGKSCVRFRSLDGLLFEAIAPLIAATPVEALIAEYEAARSQPAKHS